MGGIGGIRGVRCVWCRSIGRRVVTRNQAKTNETDQKEQADQFFHFHILLLFVKAMGIAFFHYTIEKNRSQSFFGRGRGKRRRFVPPLPLY